jgi:hypothetical protein
MENLWTLLMVIGIIFGFIFIQNLFQKKRERHIIDDEE